MAAGALIVFAGLLDFFANWLASRYLIPAGSLLIPAGTAVFAISFVVFDLLRRYWGRRATITAMLFGLSCSALYVVTLGGGSFGRIAVAGLVAEVVSLTTDFIVQGRMMRFPLFGYVLASNAASLALDTLVFSLVAFAGNPHLGEIMAGQYLAKLLTTAAAIPLVYAARRYAPAPRSAVAVSVGG